MIRIEKNKLLFHYLVIFFLSYSPSVFSLSQSDLEDDEILVVEGDNVSQKLNQASEGQTLVFDVGNYEINLLIDKTVHLKGLSTADVILQGIGLNPVIEVSNGVAISIQNMTFIESNIGVSVGSSNVTIQNNIFLLGDEGIAVQADSESNLTVVNNVFNDIRTAVEVLEEAKSHIVKNNIFSDLPDNGEWFQNLIDDVSYNCFDQVVPGYSETKNNKVISDLGFSDLDNNDFHLTNDSACKDTGLDDFGDSVDMGAYGAAEADQYTFPVANIVFNKESDGIINVGWKKNEDHRLDGYLVYYGPNPIRQITSASERAELVPKLIPSADTLTFQVDDLLTTVEQPNAPVLSSVVPVSSGKLTVNWQKAINANSYTIYYQADGGSIASESVGDIASHTLTGLVNEASYSVWITATNKYKYYFQVVGFIDDEDDDNRRTEGLFIREDSTYLEEDKDLESNDSLIKIAIPEAVEPYPALPNEGCFIATAAFGYYSHNQVQILRDFRDNYLLTNEIGVKFVTWYYEYGPHAAIFISEHEFLKPIVRAGLFPLILLAQAIAIDVTAFLGLLIAYLFIWIAGLKMILKYRFKGLNAC